MFQSQSGWHLTVKTVLVGVMVLSLVGASASQPKKGEWVKRKNPNYPIAVSIPADWSARVERDKIIPIDTWILSPAGADLFDFSVPRIVLLLNRLPRTGRQSAFFPGEIGPDRRALKINFAGKLVEAKEEAGNKGTKLLLADVEREGLFVGIKAVYKTGSDKLIILEILKNMQIEKASEREKK